MKKVILFSIVSLFMLLNVYSQKIKQIAVKNSNHYELLFVKSKLAAIFQSQISPYINPGSRNAYQFVDIVIDDANPLDMEVKAYAVITAVSANDNVTIGIKLDKMISGNQTSLYLKDYSPLRNAPEEEQGWKCTSTSPVCGGCIKIRRGGAVVGCQCLGGSGFCNFETTGGLGSNWPGWITSIVITLLGFL